MTDKVDEKTLQEVHSALNELRSEVEKKGADLEKIEKINSALDSYEEKNQKLVASQEADRKAAEELKERIDTLEVELAHSHKSSEGSYRDSAEYKALEAFAKFGDNIDQEQKALLRTDVDTDGGYRTSEELDPVIIKKITEVSPVRTVARVRTVSEKTLRMVTRDSLLTAAYEGESEQDQESASAYGQELMNTYRLSVTVPVTLDMLMNDSFTIENDIMTDASEAFGSTEGNKFVLGTGHKQPSGFLVDSRITGLTSGTTGAVDADDYLLIQGELKAGYRGTFAFNRKTLANLRTKKSTDGVYLFAPGLNGGAAATIGGDPYILMNDMPDIGAGNKAVAYGDFFRGYTITDRTGMSMIRDDYTKKRQAIVEFTLHRWNSGAVVLPEAIKTITVKS